MIRISDKIESEVRGYCRAYPTIFDTAEGSFLYDKDGKKYIDFLDGAGTLNYGHNNPVLRETAIQYLNKNGILHGLDMATTAKEEFLKTFYEKILVPRNMNYKLQFTGPTGTNAVEASLKLARKITKRTNVISFTNGFHGVSIGSLAATGNRHHRGGSGIPLSNVAFMPYDGYMGKKYNTIDYIRKVLEDYSSGIDLPAAFIVETVQGEGGINVATERWLKSLSELTKEFEMLLIIDDIQVGCGRTGTFFSFENMDIEPDMITLSKSLSGFGLPFSLLLLKPEIDKWKPGEHIGTFRGNNLAFVTATQTINQYWSSNKFESEVKAKSIFLKENLERIVKKELSLDVDVRGRGMVMGVDFILPELAAKIQKKAFENGLILETCGPLDEVVKFLPALTIERDTLLQGLTLFEKSVKEAMSEANFEQRLEEELKP